MRAKQVILIRRDLKMRRGKEIAQGSHASMDFLVAQLRNSISESSDSLSATQFEISEIQRLWISKGMAKVCLQVHSEQELLEFHEKAISAGLTSHLIRDSGRTEFDGVPTYTACAIGPNAIDRIDAITGGLKLY